MFSIEAILSLLLGPICLNYLVDRSSETAWLTSEKSATVEADLSVEHEPATNDRETVSLAAPCRIAGCGRSECPRDTAAEAALWSTCRPLRQG